MQPKTIKIAALVLVVLVIIGAMYFYFLKKTPYALTNLWFNVTPSTGGALVLGTTAPLSSKMLGKRASVMIKSTNADAQLAGVIAAAFAAYHGKIVAIDVTGKQVTLAPAPSALTGTTMANLQVVGTLTVYGM